MAEVNIRRMTIEDVDSVHAIECATFPKPWQREDFVKEMTQNTCARYLVAETDGNVIGFAGTWIVLDEAHITNVAVLEAYRGQGIGKKLTGALMQYAANLGVTFATLEVRRSNERAQNLYKGLGFQYVGVRKRYYEDNGEDAFIFCCIAMPKPEDDFEEVETLHMDEPDEL